MKINHRRWNTLRPTKLESTISKRKKWRIWIMWVIFVILNFTYCYEIESAPKPQLFFSIPSRFYVHIFLTLCINFQVIEKRFGELITHIDDDKTDEDIFHKISKKKVNSISKRKSMAAIQQLRRRRKTSQVFRSMYQTTQFLIVVLQYALVLGIGSDQVVVDLIWLKTF